MMTFSVTVAGSKLSLLIPVEIETFCQINTIPCATIRLSQPGETQQTMSCAACQRELRLCQPGNTLTLAVNKGQGKDQMLFVGVITRQTLQLRQNQMLLTLTVKHPLQKLVNTHRSQLFHEQSDQQILASTLQQHQIKCGFKVGKALQQQHEQMIQFRCSDWHFLLSRLFATHTLLVPGLQDIQVISPAQLPGSKIHQLKSNRQQSQESEVKEISLLFDDQPLSKAVEVSAWDIQQQAMRASGQQGKTDADQNSGSGEAFTALSPLPWDLFYSTPLSQSESLALAKSTLFNQKIAGIRGEFLLKGDDRYQLTEQVRLVGMGKAHEVSGAITAICHHFSKQQGWLTTLKTGLQPPLDLPLIPAAGELHIGIVGDYQQDKTGLQRIPVMLPVLQQPKKTLWARLGKPYASKESGFCFYPEPGDEVIIGFFEQDPRYPVVLGAMHNPKNRAPFEAQRDNPQKALIVRQGDKSQQLLMDGQSHLLTLQAGESQLTLQQDGNILLQGNKELTLKAAKVNIQAEESLDASGKNSVAIKGGKINLTQ